MCFRILPHSVQTPFSRFLTDLFLVLWLTINFVGTPACCVQRVSSELCHKQISRISRNKRHFCEIGEICVREKSSDTARNVPTPSLLIAHCSPLKIFLLSKQKWKRKTFLVFTDNNHKRSKTSKNTSKRASESAQLEKNNFSTEKKYFSNREIKFSQLAVLCLTRCQFSLIVAHFLH